MLIKPKPYEHEHSNSDLYTLSSMKFINKIEHGFHNNQNNYPKFHITFFKNT